MNGYWTSNDTLVLIDTYFNSMFFLFCFQMRFLKRLPFYQYKVVLNIVKHKVFIEGLLTMSSVFSLKIMFSLNMGKMIRVCIAWVKLS